MADEERTREREERREEIREWAKKNHCAEDDVGINKRGNLYYAGPPKVNPFSPALVEVAHRFRVQQEADQIAKWLADLPLELQQLVLAVYHGRADDPESEPHAKEIAALKVAAIEKCLRKIGHLEPKAAKRSRKKLRAKVRPLPRPTGQ